MCEVEEQYKIEGKVSLICTHEKLDNKTKTLDQTDIYRDNNPATMYQLSHILTLYASIIIPIYYYSDLIE